MGTISKLLRICGYSASCIAQICFSGRAAELAACTSKIEKGNYEGFHEDVFNSPRDQLEYAS